MKWKTHKKNSSFWIHWLFSDERDRINASDGIDTRRKEIESQKRKKNWNA